jgi:hypothetical protein
MFFPPISRRQTISTTGRGGIRIEGINRTLARMQRLAKNNRKALARGMQKAGDFLLKESKMIVPVDTGKLRRSGFNRLTEDKRKSVVFQVGYSRRYAVYVHERLDLAHKSPTSAKFLEKPARKHRKTLIKIVETEVRKAGA